MELLPQGLHTGGLVVAMAAGGTRLTNPPIPPTTWRALYTPDQAEMPGVY